MLDFAQKDFVCEKLQTKEPKLKMRGKYDLF